MPRGNGSGSRNDGVASAWPEWRKPISQRLQRPWPNDGTPHQRRNLNWETFQEANQQNAGHEVYRLLSETAVHTDHVDASTAALLRCLNKTFKYTIDPLIPYYMSTQFNVRVKELHDSIRDDIDHWANEVRLPRTGPILQEEQTRHEEWMAQNEVNQARLTAVGGFIERKFGYHTHMTLRKCMSEHVHGQRGGGVILGWTPRPDDVPRLGTTVHAYLAMAGKHTCELHAGKKHCECSDTMGGGFAFVPNCHGLIMHCCESCIKEHSISISPSSGTPIVPRSPRGTYNEGMRELCYAIMLQLGIQPPYLRDAIRQRIGQEVWQIKLHNVYGTMIGRRLDRPNASHNLSFLVLDTPSTSQDRAGKFRHRCAETFQSLMNASKEQVGAAYAHIAQSDRLVDDMRLAQRSILKKHAMQQFNALLLQHGCQEGLAAVEFDDLAALLPGSAELVQRAVLEPIMDTPLEKMREAHVLSSPFTMRLLSACVLALGQLRRHDAQFSGREASTYAYSYVTGMCAGKDASFCTKDISAQVNLDVCERGVSLECWRTLVTTMHVFDALDYTSIRVVECPVGEVSDFMRNYYGGTTPHAGSVFKWSMDVGGLRLEGPMVTPTCREWYAEKKEAGEALLAGLGYRPEFVDVPSPRHFRVFVNDNLRMHCGEDPCYDAAIKLLVHWFQHTAQHLCARPETRAIGLDILTGDMTRNLIKIVGASELDAECVAAAGASMQVEEMVEDAVE